MSSNSLRPAWKGGRGFQPPPQVASERTRSQSLGAAVDTPQSGSFNKFAALDDDDDVVGGEETTHQQQLQPPTNSRSEGLRSKSTGERTKSGGRSLADLAARVPERPPPSNTGRFGGARGTAEEKVVRYTREKLLSMRPTPKQVPDVMKPLEGSVILADEAQDPVCFDDLDAEAIWATIPRRAPKAVPEGAEPRRVPSRREQGSSSGRWQRGVALPPPDKQKREKEADNPSDLWDDPVASSTGASADFSAFGALPDEKESEPFDFEKMAAASAKLEEELHGTRSRASSDVEDDELENTHSVKIDAARPLASKGTTIRAGSGDDVNVFEDFDEPGSEAEEPPAIKNAGEDTSASSRLMAMIGVKKEEEPESTGADAPPAAEPKGLTAWGGSGEPATGKAAAVEGPALSLNPWGDPVLGGASNENKQGLDLQSRLREAEMEQQKAREAELRRRQEEEAQRVAVAKQQAERQQAQAAAQQQQQQGVQSQVELVLMERVSTILENSWGRSDLMSILSTLHAEDSRVIPLLNNVDALRSLLMRNPRRVALRHDAAFGAEMAVLLMSNTQWQQQQQAEARAQHEEMQRREQQRQMEEQQKAARSQTGQQSIVPGAPWYYSDPQRNIQGPFRGEEMRQWLEAGYFKGDLPISQSPTGPFQPLSSVFLDLSKAFMSQSSVSAEDEARAQAEQEEKGRLEAERAKAEAEAAERERRAREAVEASERVEQERRRKEAAETARRAEQERRAREKASNSNNGGNESSAQLKMMLGVSAQGNGATAASAPQAETSAPKPSEKRPSKSSNKKNTKDSHAAPDHAQAKPTAPAWGGASQPTTRKSMSEIQKEEARIAALQAMDQPGSRSSSSGWANVAASKGGSSGWSGGAAKQVPAAVITNPAAVAPVPLPARTKSVPSQTGLTSSKPAPQTQRNSSTSSSVAEEFGAKMSPALEKWCKDEMMKLNGTDDITLAAFCMSLDDPSEIRQYLTAYLGSTPQVNNFATEFINRKGGSKKQQEEWETTGTTKKKGKKKTGGR